jgi:hypothetical protein
LSQSEKAIEPTTMARKWLIPSNPLNPVDSCYGEGKNQLTEEKLQQDTGQRIRVHDFCIQKPWEF